MRFTVTERGAALLVPSPDVPGWSRVVRGRDGLWHALGDARRRMSPSNARATWPAADNDGTAWTRRRSAPRKAAAERRALIPRMRDDGQTITQIAEHFNVSEATIYNDFGCIKSQAAS